MHVRRKCRKFITINLKSYKFLIKFVVLEYKNKIKYEYKYE